MATIIVGFSFQPNSLLAAFPIQMKGFFAVALVVALDVFYLADLIVKLVVQKSSKVLFWWNTAIHWFHYVELRCTFIPENTLWWLRYMNLKSPPPNSFIFFLIPCIIKGIKIVKGSLCELCGQVLYWSQLIGFAWLTKLRLGRYHWQCRFGFVLLVCFDGFYMKNILRITKYLQIFSHEVFLLDLFRKVFEINFKCQSHTFPANFKTHWTTSFPLP